MSLYDLLVIIHVFAAILGLGPGFVMIYIVTNAKDMRQLRHAYHIRNRIHHFVMVGGTLLLLTGLGMGIMNPYLFSQYWFLISLVLFLVALAAGPLVLSPRAKPIKEILADDRIQEIPDTYEVLAKELFFYERMTNISFLIIILLMITKPF